MDLYNTGASDREVCKSLKVTYEQFTSRYKTDPAFAAVVDYGRLASYAWWLELGRLGASGAVKGFNFQPWYANMKNRFGWSDKVEATIGDDKPVDQYSHEELMSQLSKYRGKVAALLKTENIFSPLDGSASAN